MLTQLTRSKTSLILLGFMFMCISGAFAQRPERIKVKPTDGKLSAAIRSEAYYYPEFKEGEISFRSGKTIPGSLNYNMLTGEIEFINSKKDTLALANMFDVTQVSFGKDSFYYDTESHNLLKLLEDYNDTKLLVSERYELTNIKSIGAFGMESNSLPPTSSSRNQNIGDIQNKLKQNESMVYSARSSFYFADQEQYLPASRTNALRLFPKHRSEIKKYIKENNTNFNDKEDVSKLLQFASGL